MAVHTIQWVRNMSGGVPGPIRSYPILTGQTFKRGAPVVFDTSSEQIKLADVTVANGLGIALEDASATAGTMTQVLLFAPGQIFSATISTSGANDAAAHDRDAIGEDYGFILSTETGETTKYVIDDAEDLWFVCIDRDKRDEWGTSGGRMLFTVVPAIYLEPNVT